MKLKQGNAHPFLGSARERIADRQYRGHDDDCFDGPYAAIFGVDTGCVGRDGPRIPLGSIVLFVLA